MPTLFDREINIEAREPNSEPSHNRNPDSIQARSVT